MLRLNIIALLALVSVSINVLAEKPDGAGGNKHKPHGKHEKSSQNHAREVEEHSPPQAGYQPYFNEQHRSVIREFYANEIRSGSCPPGLAKKQNGCLPPGQAKRWALGQTLPRDVTYYDLPDAVMRQIGYPPAGYRFIRVDSDVLMLTIGTGLVIDAMSNLLSSQ